MPELPAEVGRRFQRARQGLLAGFLTAGVVAMVLCFFLAQRGAPHWVFFLAFFGPFVLLFVIAAAAGWRTFRDFLRTLPSLERRVARQADIEAAVSAWAQPAAPVDDWPTVPKKDLSDSPGRTLAVRLPAEKKGEACLLGCLIPFSAVWIGGVYAFGSGVLRGHLQGKGDWLATLFLIPFLVGVLVLVGAILYLTFQVIVRLLVGRVAVELSAHPLVAGRRYELVAEQTGLLPLGSARVALVCEESATYSQGTTSTTDRREVSARDLLSWNGRPESLGGARRTLEVPAGAMHSFESKNNKVTWKVVVRGRAGGLFPAQIDFPVVVYPAQRGAGG
jgi:hypothetical protein